MTDITDNAWTAARFEGLLGAGSMDTASYSGSFETEGDVDWIRVTLVAGNQYQFHSSVDTFSGDSFLELYDFNGKRLDYNDDTPGGGTLNSRITYTPVETGIYYIAVSDLSASPGTYSIFATLKTRTDRILGGGADVFIGSTNNERIHGGLGGDVITIGTSIDAMGEQGDDTIFGNANTNTISGGLGNDVIHGGDGSDYLFGDAGNDIIYTDTGADSIWGGDGNDKIFGGNGSSSPSLYGGAGDDIIVSISNSDHIYGNDGNDRLDAGTGADNVFGGNGNDVYTVRDANAKLIELNATGIDTVVSSVAISLTNSDQVLGVFENVTLFGNGAISASGNAIANILVGNGAQNVLSGNAGNDTLDGGAGADQMSGGAGNDTFRVDNVGDKVFEAAGGGTDTVFASVSYTLAAGQHVETLGTTAPTGTGAISLAGNELAQRINGNNSANGLYGNGGNDTLYGYGGNDMIAGGVGNDTLTGGVGTDYFVFNTALNPTTNVDRIIDFSVPADTIRLDNAVMAGLGATLGTLASDKFWKSASGLAHDADDRIIYETDSGKLFYDANGSAAGGSTHFATLAANLALTYADFQVI